jgi:hypothetical protein
MISCRGQMTLRRLALGPVRDGGLYSVLSGMEVCARSSQGQRHTLSPLRDRGLYSVLLGTECTLGSGVIYVRLSAFMRTSLSDFPL